MGILPYIGPKICSNFISPLTYNNNVWHHAVATRVRTGGAMNLYVDGTLVASGTGGANSLTDPTQMRIGCLQTNANFFNGSISTVAVYNRALSAAEIQQNFNALRGRYGI
jgi:sialidase-1